MSPELAQAQKAEAMPLEQTPLIKNRDLDIEALEVEAGWKCKSTKNMHRD